MPHTAEQAKPSAKSCSQYPPPNEQVIEQVIGCQSTAAHVRTQDFPKANAAPSKLPPFRLRSQPPGAAWLRAFYDACARWLTNVAPPATASVAVRNSKHHHGRDAMNSRISFSTSISFVPGTVHTKSRP